MLKKYYDDPNLDNGEYDHFIELGDNKDEDEKDNQKLSNQESTHQELTQKGAMKLIGNTVLPYSFAGFISIAGGVINSIILSRLGPDTVAASSLIFSTQTFLTVIPSVTLYAEGGLISQAHGQGRNSDVGSLYRSSLSLATILSVPVVILMEFSEPILVAFGQEKNLAKIAQDYFRGYVFVVPLSLWLEASRQLLLGISKPGSVLALTCINTVLTSALTYVLALGKLGSREYGVVGQPYAEAISSTIVFAALLLYFRLNKSFSGYEMFKTRFKEMLGFLKQLCSVGLPIAIQVGFDLGMVELMTLMIGRLGRDSLIIRQVSQQFGSLFIVPFLAVAQTATVVCGQLVGEKRFSDVRRTGNIAIIIGLGLGLVALTVFTSVPRQLLSTYVDLNDINNANLIKMVRPALGIVGGTLVADSVRYVLGGTLRSYNDTQFPVVSSVVGLGVIGALTAYITGIVLDEGLDAILSCQGIGITAATLMLSARWMYVTSSSIKEGEYNPGNLFQGAYNKCSTLFSSCRNRTQERTPLKENTNNENIQKNSNSIISNFYKGCSSFFSSCCKNKTPEIVPRNQNEISYQYNN